MYQDIYKWLENRETVRKPAATFFIYDPGEHGVIEAEVLCCCHCSRTWVPIKGSGRKRGFCMNCNQVTCGAERCDPCVPFEKKLDLIEAGKASPLIL